MCLGPTAGQAELGDIRSGLDTGIYSNNSDASTVKWRHSCVGRTIFVLFVLLLVVFHKLPWCCVVSAFFLFVVYNIQ